MRFIDFRSDTASPITNGMRTAIQEAIVGDDILGEDPNVNRLEEMSAQLFGKEAALFLPTGTMANQVALMSLTAPGDEAVLFGCSHIYNLECGGLAALSGVQVRAIESDDLGAAPSRIAQAVRPSGIQYAHTRVLCLENTLDLNRGIPLSPTMQQEMADAARRNGAKVYLDGARIFNAAVAHDRPLAEFGASVDCLQFCLNKGLSAPVGAMLVGDKPFIQKARHIRQRLGGAARHIGYMAAAGVVALDEMIPRMAEDHRNASRLRDGLRAIDECLVDVHGHHTNIIRLNVAGTGRDVDDVVAGMLKSGIQIKKVDNEICRMVTHSGTSAADVDAALEAVRQVF